MSTAPHLERVACSKKEPHAPHLCRSAITGRYRWCIGGPILRWQGDDA